MSGTTISGAGSNYNLAAASGESPSFNVAVASQESSKERKRLLVRAQKLLADWYLLTGCWAVAFQL